jgi:glutamine synthetase
MIENNNFNLQLLSETFQKDNLLEKLSYQFKKDYKLTPCFGVEIEFYLSPNVDIGQFENMLELKLKKEKGKNQWEIDLSASSDLTEYSYTINNTKAKIQNTAKILGGNADLRAKPNIDDYGNSMHFHLNFLSNQSCVDLDFIAQTLCHFMLDSFIIFMPNEEDYLRIKKGFMTPTHVSYGDNNRTTAIRILNKQPRRLEHRLPSPLADPYLVMTAILKHILLGIQSPNNINNLLKTYGNAFDEQYNLTPLPKTRMEAIRLFKLDIY